MNTNHIICFDFETTGLDTETCHPIQIAAIVIDPRKLEVIPGATFNSMMCPDIKPEQWVTAEEDWKKALEINNKTMAQIKAAPKEGEVWKAFVGFVNKYNPQGNHYNAPIAAGQNIDRYDTPIADRLNKKHKIPKKENKPLLFNTLISLDLKNFLFAWFEGNNELKNYSMNTVRPYMGISSEGAHDALVDVEQTAAIIIKFLKLHRRLFPNIPFKGCFSRENKVD